VSGAAVCTSNRGDRFGPFDFGGAIPCCMGLDGVELGWPVAWHPQWVAYAKAKGNANFFHGRLGPFLSESEPDLDDLSPASRIRLAAIKPRLELQQVTSAEIGGPYLEVDGKADLTSFNKEFWDAIYSWADAICAGGGWVEADMIDGWYIKHAKWGDVLHPWRADGNVQGQDWATAAGTRAIQPGDVYDQYLRQAVTVLGPLGCLVWQGGNENGQIPGYSKDWDLSMRRRAQVHEREVGLGVVHLFGTNAQSDEVEAGDVDYVSTHEGGTTVPRHGKPTLQNERNPAPPPADYLDLFCASKAAGGYVWYWRSEHTQAQMEETLGLIAAARRDGCPGSGAAPRGQ
jgi:hypothetical protein